jgi:hypothetical protein
MLVADESMSAWVPHNSFIKRKPELLGILHLLIVFFNAHLFFSYLAGTKFKNIACGVLGILLCLEIQRGKEGMKTKEFNASFGATAGSTMCLAQLAAPVREGEEKPLVEGDAWFGSVTCAAELALQHYDCFLQIKTNSSLFQMLTLKQL